MGLNKADAPVWYQILKLVGIYQETKNQNSYLSYTCSSYGEVGVDE